MIETEYEDDEDFIIIESHASTSDNENVENEEKCDEKPSDDFVKRLSLYPELGKVFQTRYSKSHKFLIRTAGKSKEDVKMWVQRFSDVTATNYIVKTTDPGKNKMRYVCAFSSKNKKLVNDHHAARNKNCNASLCFAIGSEEVQMSVKVNWSHNHVLTNKRNLSMLRVSSETVDRFESYFADGDDVGSSMRRNLEYLESEYPGEPSVRDNGQLSPPSRVVRNLFNRFVSRTLGGFEPGKIIEKIGTMKQQWQENGGFVACNNSPFIVVCATPVMVRTWDLFNPNSVIFCDSTSKLDSTDVKVTLFVLNTPVGGLPLCYVLTYAETEEVFTPAFEMVRESVLRNRTPASFMTDDCQSLRNTIKSVFPEARSYVCVFHKLQADWTWLLSKPQLKRVRQSLMQLIRTFIMSPGEEESENAYSILMKRTKRYPDLHARLEKAHSGRMTYCVCTRSAELFGQQTNNLAESAVRCLKESIMFRRRSHNPVSLLASVMHMGYLYYQGRLSDYATGRNTKSFTEHAKLTAVSKYMAQLTLLPDTNGNYEVPSSCGTSVYTVDTKRGICTCYVGMTGRLCKHVHGLKKHHNVTIGGRVDPTTAVVRQQMSYLAFGRTEDLINYLFDNIEDASDNVAAPSTFQQLPAAASGQQVPAESTEELVEEATTKFRSILIKSGRNATSLRRLLKTMAKAHPNKVVEAIFSCHLHPTHQARGAIPVMPTSVGRRTHNKIKGRAAVLKGRPRHDSKPVLRSRKPHRLASAVAKNTTSARW